MDETTFEPVYDLVGGKETAVLLSDLHAAGWLFAWASNDDDDAIDVYKAAVSRWGVEFDVFAHGQRVHEVRLNVVLQALQLHLSNESAASSLLEQVLRDVHGCKEVSTTCGMTDSVTNSLMKHCFSCLRAFATQAKGAFDARFDPSAHPSQWFRGCSRFMGDGSVIKALANELLAQIDPPIMEVDDSSDDLKGVTEGERPGGSGMIETALESCVWCALQNLFMRYKFVPQDVIPPHEVRSALGVLNAEHSRFQVGLMDDATEALEAVLRSFHADQLANAGVVVSMDDVDDHVCTPPCLSHEMFSCVVIDQFVCTTCRAQEEPTVSSEFVYRAYVSELAERDWELGDALHKLASRSQKSRHPSM